MEVVQIAQFGCGRGSPLPSRDGNMAISRNKSQLEMEEAVDNSDSPGVVGGGNKGVPRRRRA